MFEDIKVNSENLSMHFAEVFTSNYQDSWYIS